MPTSKTLLDTLIGDYPKLTFSAGSVFAWSPPTATITYDPDDPYYEARLLHELSHALLHHEKYNRDIDLLACERDAWQMARGELSQKYGVAIAADIVHHDMDSYRDWLHARSTCPHCGSSGIETKKHLYKCVTCLKSWKVNDARTCQLRRWRV